MKKCPYCAEAIQEEAIICRHCLRDLWPAPHRARSIPNQLLSSLEYVLIWLKLNNPDLYRVILAKMLDSQSKATPTRIPRKYFQPTKSPRDHVP